MQRLETKRKCTYLNSYPFCKYTSTDKDVYGRKEFANINDVRNLFDFKDLNIQHLTGLTFPYRIINQLIFSK